LPVPASMELPLCGDGGPGGDEWLRRMLPQIPSHLSESGRALIYAEDFGGIDEPDFATWLSAQPWTNELDVNMYITGSRFHERSALNMTAIWQLCGASEQEAWQAWNAFQTERGFSHNHSFILDIRHGFGGVAVRKVPRF